MKNAIRDVSNNILEAEKNLESYDNELRQLDWDAFERLHETIAKTYDETDTLLNLMDGKDLFDKDTGEITEYGLANQGLHVTRYKTYRDEVEKYSKEIKEALEDIAEDPEDQEAIKHYEELIQKQREAAEGMKNEEDAIKDLASEYHDNLLSALSEIIDKRKEALSDMSDLLDYEKDVADQTKNISSLEKQLDAAKANNTEAGKANAQRLQEELNEARENLDKTQYDKWVEDQEKMLDSMNEDFEEFLSNRLENTEKLISDAITATTNGSSDIRKTLIELAQSYGLDVSSSLLNTVSGTPATIQEGSSSDLFKDKLTPTFPSSEPTLTQEDYMLSPNGVTNLTWGKLFTKKKYSGKKTKSDTDLVKRLQYFDFDSSSSARAKYYSAMGLGKESEYTGTKAQNAAMIKEMKKHGYKNGGTIGDLIKSTHEDGFILARTGEEVITKEKLSELRSVFDKLDLANGYFDSMKAIQALPNVRTESSNLTVNNTIESITMNGVNDPEEFTRQLNESLKNSQSTKKILQSETVGTLNGVNSLIKFRY